jgi:hypothetical protein
MMIQSLVGVEEAWARSSVQGTMDAFSDNTILPKLQGDAMADKDKSGKVTQADSSKENRTDKVSGRSFGRGMTSPDSREAVLDASTGEVDPRAAGEGALPPGESEPNPKNRKKNS